MPRPHTGLLDFRQLGSQHVDPVDVLGGDIETYVYEANNWLKQVTDGNSHTRTYDFGIRGDVVKLTMPDGTIEQWTYNGTGDVTKYTSPHTGGAAYDIDYVYDDAGRLSTIDYDSGTDTTFAYDALGRRVEMVDSTGTTEWTYNAAGQLTGLDTPQGDIGYSYFDDGRIETMTNVGTGDTDYAYDSATGLLETITNPFSEVTTLEYDSLGRLERETKHSGEYTLMGYDSRNRVISIGSWTASPFS